MKRGLVVVLALALDPTTASAQSLTLEQMRERALGNRPELRQGDARIEEASARVDVAQAARRPRVAGTVEASVFPGGELVEIPTDPANPNSSRVLVQGSPALDQGSSAFAPNFAYSGLVGVDWTLYDFGRSRASEAAAVAQRRAEEAQKAATERSLLRQVDALFLQWLLTDHRARAERATRDRVEGRRRELSIRVEEGAASRSDLLALDADVAGAELRLAYALEAADRTRAALAEAVGSALEQGAAPDDALLRLEAPRTPTEETAPGAERSLELRTKAAEQSARATERTLNPQLSVSAQAGLRGQLDSLFPVYRGILSLRIPFWDGGVSAANAEASRAQARALEAERDAMNRKRTAERRRAEVTLQSAKDRVRLASDLYDATRARLEDTEQRFAAGAARPDELTRAQAAHDRAKDERLQARVDRARAILNLETM